MREHRSIPDCRFLYQLSHSKFDMSDIRISPDSQTLFTTDGVNVKRWKLATGEFLEEIFPRGSLIEVMAISPNGEILATAGQEYKIGLWNLSRGESMGVLEHMAEWQHEYKSAVFCPDNETLLVGGDILTESWNVRTQKNSQDRKPHTLGGRLAISPNGHILAGALSEVEFTKAGGRPHRRLGSLRNQAKSLPPQRIWLPSPRAGRGAGGEGDNSNLARGKLSACIGGLAISEDGRTCGAGLFDGKIEIWDWETGASRQTIEAHTDIVRSLAFSPDGQVLVSCGYDKQIKFWDVGSGRFLSALEEQEGRVYGLAWSRDGRFLASRHQNKIVKVWEVVGW